MPEPPEPPGGIAVDGLWDGRPHERVAVRAEDGLLRPTGAAAEGPPRLPVTLMPGLVDHHVHLGLVDRSLLADGVVVEAHDLGWSPAEASTWRAGPPAGLTVRAAGPFHTAPGGYPSGRSWAPAGAVRAVAGAVDARAAVADAVAGSYDMVKVALHAGMPLLGEEALTALVTAAHEAGLSVVAHTEGPGQARRAVEAGVDVLAHTPWTERLDDALLQRAVAMTWISTLAIHAGADRDRALDNLTRFHALGGRVRYGTDMGNGPTPVGANAAEILALGEAGLAGDDLLTALTGHGGGALPTSRLLASAAPPPSTAHEAAAWVAGARRLPAEDLEEARV